MRLLIREGQLAAAAQAIVRAAAERARRKAAALTELDEPGGPADVGA